MSTKSVILVVNEQTFLVDLLIQTLGKEELCVIGSASAGEAAVLFGERQPNLAIVDTEISGALELIHLICKSGEACAVIALTNSAETRSSLNEMGVETIVDKAVSLKVLLRTIHSYVNVEPAIPHTTADAKILIVDDEEEIREIQASILARKGYSVVTAADGHEALNVLHHDGSIAVVLLDIQIPGRGGLDVLSEISNSRHRPEVIMVSAMVDEQIAKHSRRLGAFDYLLKPIEPEALEGVIIASLSHAAYLRQSIWHRIWD